LFQNGFISNYNVWTEYEERGIMLENDKEEEDDIPNFVEDYGAFFEDTTIGEPEEDAEAQVAEDDLGQMLREAEEICETVKESTDLRRMLEDYITRVKKKVGTILELLQWKASNGLSDKKFKELLKLIKNLLPEGNTLLETTYEASRVVCPLGLEAQKIHACPNDCILYRGEEYENLDACPVCKACRYKIPQEDPGDVEGVHTKKRVLAKVMWYFSIIPHLKRLFMNKTNAKLMRWYKEIRKQGCDGSQWRQVDSTFPTFADDARNIRFRLSTDGMNPFTKQSSGHSTWAVTLYIYNLSPWLCTKRKFIMMPMLIPDPKQPDNDIDVYLKPLVDDLLLLWKEEGVRVWDAHVVEHFDLRALLFITVKMIALHLATCLDTPIRVTRHAPIV
jgi:hypothetical protein